MKSLFFLFIFCSLFVCYRDNTINILFELKEEKFQDCFKYFNVAVLKKKKITDARKVKVPYFLDKQKVSYHV